MKITVKQLKFRNFKKLRNLTIDFDPKMTNILGANGTGKTSVLDGFNWLLFGKNSENKADFSIKTLDSENKPIPKLEHEVSGVLDVNGKETVLTRIYKEKYTKKRGSAIEEFSGHLEEYFINEVPVKAGEYNSFVNELFGTNFRMLTDCNFFNETMKWEQRREILISMSGNVSFDKIIEENPKLDLVIGIVKNSSEPQKSIDDQKKINASKRTKIKEQIESIPARLDELDRQIKTDLQPIEELNKSKSELNSQIEENRKAINNEFDKQKKANEENALIVRKRGEIEMKIQEEKSRLNRESRKETDNLKLDIQGLESTLKSLNSSYKFTNDSIQTNNSRIETLRSQGSDLELKYNAENSKSFDENELNCKSCLQPLPNESKQSLLSNFNTAKSNTLKSLIDNANEIASKIKSLKVENENLSIELTGVNEKIDATKKQIEDKKTELQSKTNVDQPELNSELLTSLNSELENIKETEIETIDNSEIEAKIKEIESQIQEVNNTLSQHQNNSEIEARIKELKSQQTTLITELDNVERFDYQIQLCMKAYITKVEDSINSMFEIVKFKMFEDQINGGERAICVCTLNGVPYPDVNTAGKINAGLDIIKALQLKLGLNAPIFIDNRESVTQIIPMESQIINLIVDSNSTQLSIQ
jgi:DNA repair protein SbcC/Rad50